MKKITKISLLSSTSIATIISIPIIATSKINIHQDNNNSNVFYRYSTVQNNNVTKNHEKYIIEEFSNLEITSNWMQITKDKDIITVSGDTLYKINESGVSKAISGPKFGKTKIDYTGSSILQSKDGSTYVTLKNESSGLFKTGVYKINLENFSTPTLVTEFKGEKNIGPFFEASNKDIYLFVGNKIMRKTGDQFVSITTKPIPDVLSKKNPSDFLDKASINELDGVIYVGTKYGLFKLDSTNPNIDNNLVMVDSNISFENSYIKNIDGKLYMRAHFNGKNENKLFLVSTNTSKIEQIATKFNDIGGIARLSDYTFIINTDKGIYKSSEKELDKNNTWVQMIDGNWKDSLDITTSYNKIIYVSSKEFRNVKNNIYKISLKDNPDSIISWHNFYNDIDIFKIQVDTKIHQNGLILQYKNNNEWKNVDKSGIIVAKPGSVEFRWVPDSLNSFMYLNGKPLGDKSGNTYTKEQLEAFNKKIKPAPANVNVNDVVKQENIDKRNGYTLNGKPVFSKEQLKGKLKDRKAVFFDLEPFGIEDDDSNPDKRIKFLSRWVDSKKYITAPIDKKFLINGQSINFEFDMSVSNLHDYHPTLKRLAENAVNQRVAGVINVSYSEKEKKFLFKWLEKPKIDSLLGGSDFKLAVGKWSGKVGRNGVNNINRRSWVANWFKIDEKNNEEWNFVLAPDQGDRWNWGEDAAYFKNLKLFANLDSKQWFATNAKFKARKGDKLGHVYNEDEIWMRDIGSKIKGTPILGLNSKGKFESVSSTKIIIEKNILIDPEELSDKISIGLFNFDNEILLAKNYKDDELEATVEALELDPRLFRIPSGQKLHNGSNTISIETKQPAIFKDGTNNKKITFNITDKFFSIIKEDEMKYNNNLYDKNNNSIILTNKLMEINSNKFQVKDGIEVNWGKNKVALIAKKGFMFYDRKRTKIVNINVYKNSIETIKEEIEKIKEGFKGSEILNQEYNFVFQIAEEINNAINIKEKLELLKKWFGFKPIIEFGDTEIIDIIAKSGENDKQDLSNEIYLELITNSKNTSQENKTNKFNLKLVGKTDAVIANNINKIDYKLFNEYFYNSEISEENQGYRTLEEISKIIVDSDSLFLLLGGEIPKLHGSVLSKVYATVTDKTNGKSITINIEMTIPRIKEHKKNEFTKIFSGKGNSEIFKISVNKINSAQKHDAKQVQQYFYKVNKDFFIYNKYDLNKAVENTKDVHTLKKWTGLDLNISLQASIINKVEASLNSNGDISVKAFMQTYRASKQETIITQTFKTKEDKNPEKEKNIGNNFKLLLIIIFSVIGVSTLGIAILAFYLKKRRKM
ncbi:MAG: hypothetical protein GY679_03270 [Mycoplasma sp.]|nr:hypothetical protein [Mycoplasma sp.]